MSKENALCCGSYAHPFYYISIDKGGVLGDNKRKDSMNSVERVMF